MSDERLRAPNVYRQYVYKLVPEHWAPRALMLLKGPQHGMLALALG